MSVQILFILLKPDDVYLLLIVFPTLTFVSRSSVGVVVKLLACEARGLGFDSWSRRYDFRDWLSPASKL